MNTISRIMPKLLLVNGPVYDLYPTDGKKFTTQEIREILKGDFKTLELPDGYLFIVNKESDSKEINKHSSNIWYAYTNNRTKLRGDVILCKKEDFYDEVDKNGDGCSEECGQDN